MLLDYHVSERRRAVAEVEDYTTGRVLRKVKRTFDVLEVFDGILKDSRIGAKMLEEANKFYPRRASIEKAARLIQESNKCAVGERVCRALYKDTPCTKAVFLDKLAEGMVAVGKAKFATKEEALDILEKFDRNLIVVSRVSGKQVEICNTWPEKCVYWNLEKRGLRCLGRMD